MSRIHVPARPTSQIVGNSATGPVTTSSPWDVSIFMAHCGATVWRRSYSSCRRRTDGISAFNLAASSKARCHAEASLRAKASCSSRYNGEASLRAALRKADFNVLSFTATRCCRRRDLAASSTAMALSRDTALALASGDCGRNRRMSRSRPGWMSLHQFSTSSMRCSVSSASLREWFRISICGTGSPVSVWSILAVRMPHS